MKRRAALTSEIIQDKKSIIRLLTGLNVSFEINIDESERLKLLL